MEIITIIFIAFGLSMDAFAVSIASGVINRGKKYYNALKFGFFFGFFQMIMPIIGWSLGYSMRSFIASFDHWIAFFLLILIGSKMICEALRMEKTESEIASISFYVLLGLSIATSIDALAVGLSFAFLRVAIVLPSIIIGLITFALSFLGFFIGSRFGHIFEKKIEIAGGLVLIAIGIKILVQHLFL